ncbi:MAG: glycerol-3-phosphate dehydrogenase [Alphaproteobacteria bacterium]|jgi:glycerol-3-phosphate dehydrogenase (NAD(P)+)|nr:glycerol-3-phosphate dehydrogenase [Alphaproteobacteria bacterium]
MPFNHIAVLGAGAWGSALANLAAEAGRTVTLWARDPAKAAAMAVSRDNPRLPGTRLNAGIKITAVLADAARADAILLAVPAQELRAVATALDSKLAAGTPVIACAKGIEQGTCKFMTEVIEESAPGAIPAILSGPSFAADIARGLPAAVTLAARDEQTASALARALGSANFRLYHSTDIRGVEIGGAAKNVLAIAAGIVFGRGLGASAAAALTTRGFAELFRLGKAYGARPETLTGLAGLGDLILTCSSPQSRNFSVGVDLGRGPGLDRTSPGKLAEGIATAPVLVEIARQRDIDMPIASAVADVLDGRLSIDAATESLLTRPFRAE